MDRRKIYFAGSIRGGRDDVAVYDALIKYLHLFGDVLTEHVGDPSLSQKGNDGPDDRHIHDRDMAWLSACDLVVAEVSSPSLGVGYELGLAVCLKKPVLCLCRPIADRPLSAMIAGSPGIKTAVYSSMDEAKRIIVEFIHEIEKSRNKSTFPSQGEAGRGSAKFRANAIRPYKRPNLNPPLKGEEN